MRPRNKCGWFIIGGMIALPTITVIVAWIVWRQLSPNEQQMMIALVQKNFVLLFGLTGFLLTVGIFILDGIIRNYMIPIVKIESEMELIRTVNPDHRIAANATGDFAQLAMAINQWADDEKKMQEGMENRITQARAASDAEKNILAEFLSELSQGMMVCNLEGRILLYNKQARRLLGEPAALSAADGRTTPDRSYVGIGRSVFTVLENAPMEHALNEINLRLEKKSDRPSSSFVVHRAGRLLRIEVTPVLDSMQKFNGFLLVLDDFTEPFSEARRLNTFWRDHSRSLRQSFATLQAAAPRNGPGGPLRTEVERMTTLLAEADYAFGEQFGHGHWPMIDIDAAQFLEVLKYKVEESSGITLDLAADDSGCAIRIDSYAFAVTIRMLLDLLHTTLNRNHFTVALHRMFQFVGIDFLWHGAPLGAGMIAHWEKAHIAAGHETLPFTMKEVLQNHKADLFAFPEPDDDGFARLRLYLEAHEAAGREPLRYAPVLPEHRPVDFDFDLFTQTGFTTALDNEPLNQLTCTVFDTETTGLDPGAGDRIVSIGAVRVVNGRLVTSDNFDQLVNPQRGIPVESIRFHGITDEMVQQEPTVDTVLPEFYNYVASSILVAHNAAFDMRMLQIYEPYTGIKFNQPVLDTMLLSTVVHPAHQSHNLQAIAQRLGINVVGRHTALGDAMTTARLFVKLLPLLAQKGIYTLNDAREASRKSYLSRLKY